MDPDVTRPRAPLPLAGDFELVRKLGSGGFGSVFEAKHRHTGLPYAVKRIALSTEDADRFRKEALYPARIASQSLHVLSMHSFFQDEDEGFFYLVTELIPHGDLRRFLDTHPRPLPLELAFDIALGIARGLTAIHEQGIVHRDLKPGNILMDRKDDRWVPKIADFGLARSSGSVSLGDFASCGYAAPEQVDLAAEPSLGPEADLFCLGMVFYELFTGARACDAVDLREYGRWARARVPPAPPSSRRPELAGRRDCDDLIARLLEFDPARRTIAAGEVARILTDMQQTPVSARPPAAAEPRAASGTPAVRPQPSPRGPARPAASSSRKQAALLGAAVILLAGVAGGAFWMRGGGDDGVERGIADFRDGNYVRALPALLDAAEQDDAPSQAALGRMYLNGWGVERNTAEARRWLDRAAARDADARCALGDMFRDGTGVEQRLEEAFKRYTASQDAVCGQLGLAHLHLNGLGIPPSYDEALRWYEKAAVAGDPAARERLRELETGWVMDPLFAGPWQTVAGAERRTETDRLREDGILARIKAADVRRLRRLDADFYPGASIFELEVGRPEGHLGVLTYVRHADRTIVIDGRAPQIHALSASAPIRIDTIERAIAFLRFFMGAIQGEAGIFRVVDSAHDLHWLPPDGPSVRDRGVPIRRLEVQPSPAGGWRATSTIAYGTSLYQASLWLKPDGMVEMSDDAPVTPALPIAVETFDALGVRVRVAPEGRS